MAEKMTKAMWFEEIKAVVMESGAERADEMVEFIEAQEALLVAKAEKARERAAAKKADGDALRATVQSVLTDEAQLIDAIVEQIAGEGVTKAKVTARLTQLVQAGVAVREHVSVDKRKLTAYRLASEADAVEVDAE